MWRVALFAVFVSITASGQMPREAYFTYIGLGDCDSVAGWNGDIFLACHSIGDALPAEIIGGRRRGADAYVVRIDPRKNKVVYATRLGGSHYSAAFRIKVNRHGQAYVTGVTAASDFPIRGNAVQPKFGGGKWDAFLAVIAPDGNLIYSTFLGGSGEDRGTDLALDGRGGVYVGGTTWSPDFPGQPQNKNEIHSKPFVIYLRPNAKDSLRSTVFGGDSDDTLGGIALDNHGSLFVVGTTRSKNFPLVTPIQSALRGPSDAFLTRLKTSDLTIASSTYFGGSGDDTGWNVALDRQGHAVIVGSANSPDLPGTQAAFQPGNAGGKDAFVTVFRDGQPQSTYFGGTKDEAAGGDCPGCQGANLAVDESGVIWLVGYSESQDLPLKFPLHGKSEGGSEHGFIAAISKDLKKLCYSSFSGAVDGDTMEGVSTNRGLVLASGLSYAKEMPATGLVNKESGTLVFLNGEPAHAIVLELRTSHACQ